MKGNKAYKKFAQQVWSAYTTYTELNELIFKIAFGRTGKLLKGAVAAANDARTTVCKIDHSSFWMIDWGRAKLHGEEEKCRELALHLEEILHGKDQKKSRQCLLDFMMGVDTERLLSSYLKPSYEVYRDTASVAKMTKKEILALIAYLDSCRSEVGPGLRKVHEAKVKVQKSSTENILYNLAPVVLFLEIKRKGLKRIRSGHISRNQRRIDDLPSSSIRH